ncbi:30S ribosomal protein S8e [uncultured archaeon]|nr:30S ribosomal protein S8e [uncultured archaeon]
MYHGKVSKTEKKRKYNVGRQPAETGVGEVKRKHVRVKGGGFKVKLDVAGSANVLIGGKNVVCGIVTVSDNPANKDFSRRNIITKGAVIVVKDGGKEFKARVTSRPGQDGFVNAVAVE